MPSRTRRARSSSAGSGARSALHSPAPLSQSRAAAGSSSRSEAWSPSQVLTNDWTSSRGMGAGLVSWPGTHDGMVMTGILPHRDHKTHLTGLVVTSKLILEVMGDNAGLTRWWGGGTSW